MSTRTSDSAAFFPFFREVSINTRQASDPPGIRARAAPVNHRHRPHPKRERERERTELKRPRAVPRRSFPSSLVAPASESVFGDPSSGLRTERSDATNGAPGLTTSTLEATSNKGSVVVIPLQTKRCGSFGSCCDMSEFIRHTQHLRSSSSRQVECRSLLNYQATGLLEA